MPASPNSIRKTMKCKHLFEYDKVIKNVIECKYCGEIRVEIGEDTNDFDI